MLTMYVSVVGSRIELRKNWVLTFKRLFIKKSIKNIWKVGIYIYASEIFTIITVFFYKF